MFGIDIPIGLAEADSRQSDVEARRKLGSRGVCVFPAPLRSTVEGTLDDASYAKASRFQSKDHVRGKGLSQQAWRLLPKIRQVDAFLRGNMSESRRILAVHPEVSFCIWNGNIPIASRKRTGNGRAQRARLIDDQWPGQRDRLLTTLRSDRAGRFAVDDLHDAFAALCSMRRYRMGRAIGLPRTTQKDARGLPMQIIA
jgi:predicted RNase H-like nuclease